MYISKYKLINHYNKHIQLLISFSKFKTLHKIKYKSKSSKAFLSLVHNMLNLFLFNIMLFIGHKKKSINIYHKYYVI